MCTISEIIRYYYKDILVPVTYNLTAVNFTANNYIIYHNHRINIINSLFCGKTFSKNKVVKKLS